ncbi:MAG: formate dehydrogenase accessory sulfurtransferase FdhD [Deltaproteobacteria bacterium]|jgi:FdhD protein|nr:formate dehydrogenase accessory sulfurtransferase FdhD [Deltaproteobacteria bacterium]
MKEMHGAGRDAATPVPLHVSSWRAGEWRNIGEVAAREVSLRILHEGGESRLWAWPHECAELAAGHVLLDCLHDAAPDCPSPRGLPPVEVRERDGAWRVTLPPLTAAPRMGAEIPAVPPPADILARMAEFIRAPGLWDGTGCYHRAALLHAATGRFARMAEDIGRHNCLDRLAGHIALSGGCARMNPADCILFVTARITASLYCKARRLGARRIVSRAAVSTASIEMARQQDVLLIGFCRPEEERLTVFGDVRDRFAP